MTNGGRQSTRLAAYDYSQAGAYFLTMVVEGRRHVFGEIADGTMILNDFGEIISQVWCDIAGYYERVEIDAFVVMPNHLHAIVWIHAPAGQHAVVGAVHEPPLRSSARERRGMLIPKLVGRFKTITAKQINERRNTPGTPVWQRNYYDHVIRNEADLNHIREYIQTNVLRWQLDRFHGDDPQAAA